MSKSVPQAEAEAFEKPAPAASPTWALAALAICMLLSSLGTSIVNVGLPTLARAFGAPFQQVQWTVLAYLLAVTTLVVGAGRLGDTIGRRRLLLAGIVLFTVASAACAMAPTLWLLVAARAAQGLGAAVMMALATAFVADTVAKPRIGRAMGLLGSMSAVGTALGPSLGGLLITGLGWRAIFLVNLPLGGLAWWLARRHLRADQPMPAASKAGFDYLGTLLLALTLAAYALAMTIGRGHFGGLNLSLLLLALLGTVVFVYTEAHAASPLVRPAAWRHPLLRASLAMNLLVSTVMMATLVIGPFYLSLGLGLGTAMVGAVMSVGPAVAALGGFGAGRLVDRFGATAMVGAGLATMLVGTLALAALPAGWPASSSVAGYVGAIAVLTSGYALFQAANNTAVMVDVQPGPARRGLRSAQSVAQPRAGDRRGLDGCCVCVRCESRRHHDRAG